MRKDEHNLMHTFDDSLFHLWQEKLIDAEEALRLATYRDDLRLRMQGIGLSLAESDQ